MFKDRQSRLSIYVMTLGVFAVINTELGIIGVLPAISHSLGISISKAGNLVTIFALMVSISGFFISTLFHKVDRKTTLLIIIFIFGLSNIISLLVPTYGAMMFARVIAGIMHPLFWGVALSYADSLVDEQHKGRANAMVMSGVTVAMVLGIPISSYLTELFNFKAFFIFCAAINFITLISIFLILPSIKIKEEVSYGHHFKSLGKPSNLVNMLVIILTFMAMFVPYGYITQYLLTTLSVSGTTVSMLLLIFGVGGILGNHYAGKITGPKIINVMTLFIIFFLTLLIFILYINSLRSILYLIIFVWGFIQNMAPLLAQSWLLELGMKDNKELGNTVFASCANIGITFGSAFGGITIATLGINYLIPVGIVFELLVLFLVLGYRFVVKNKQLV